VVEIELRAEQEPDPHALESALADLVSAAHLDDGGHTLTIRALNAVGALPAILERLEASGYSPGEVRVRENTLEDVFIQLTGRRLRE
ncbi:MAG: multidrug ABC transporter ATP-binding protein, partial [Chloroflexota bacterium]